MFYNLFPYNVLQKIKKLLFYNRLPYNGLQTITNWKRLFLHLHVTLMEFFNASPTIAPKKGISNSIKEKREKEEKSGGGYVTPDILVQT